MSGGTVKIKFRDKNSGMKFIKCMAEGKNWIECLKEVQKINE